LVSLRSNTDSHGDIADSLAEVVFPDGVYHQCQAGRPYHRSGGTLKQATDNPPVGKDDLGQAIGYVSMAISVGTLAGPLLGGVVYEYHRSGGTLKQATDNPQRDMSADA
jgi:hypothetical protein